MPDKKDSDTPKDEKRPADTEDSKVHENADQESDKAESEEIDTERPDPEASEEDLADKSSSDDEQSDMPEDADQEVADRPAPEEDKPEASDEEPADEPVESDGSPVEESDEGPAREEETENTEPADGDEPDTSEAVGPEEPEDKGEATESVPDSQDHQDYKDMKFDAVDPNEPAVGDLVALQARRKELARQQAEADAKAESDDTSAGTKDQPSIATGAIVVGGKRSYKKYWIALIALLLIATGAWWWLKYQNSSVLQTGQPNYTTSTQQTLTDNSSAKTEALTLDTNKNYGNKYKDGLLPVGDNKYTTAGAKKGYGYVCSQYAQNLKSDTGGAGTRGPWFASNNTQYNITTKAAVRGSVKWTASFSNTVSGSYRTITTNDLPAHTTGIFPISASDPAYHYDKNPSTIQTQNLSYKLAANPSYQATPNCMGGEVGVMLDGVALFNAFDAGGRDAGAWEVQDSCDGHPQKNGEYHYHTFSSCIKQVGVDTVVGFALDGFPITGPQLGTGNILTTSDLDECHGITSTIALEGKKVSMYHYVMTEDFPYSVSCFRGTAIQPPGMSGGAQQTSTTTGTKPKTGIVLPPPR